MLSSVSCWNLFLLQTAPVPLNIIGEKQTTTLTSNLWSWLPSGLSPLVSNQSVWFISLSQPPLQLFRFFFSFLTSNISLPHLMTYFPLSLKLKQSVENGQLLCHLPARIPLPLQGTRVQSLAQEDSTCLGATKPLYHNGWAHAPGPVSHSARAPVLEGLKLQGPWATAPEPLCWKDWSSRACGPQCPSPCAGRTEAPAPRPVLGNRRGQHSEKPHSRRGAAPLTATRQAPVQQQRLSTTKTNKWNKK